MDGRKSETFLRSDQGGDPGEKRKYEVETSGSDCGRVDLIPVDDM